MRQADIFYQDMIDTKKMDWTGNQEFIFVEGLS